MLWRVVVIALACAALPVSAGHTTTIFGPGAQLCSNWTDAHLDTNTTRSDAQESWAQGFLDALAINSPGDPLPKLVNIDWTGWIGTYCASNPQAQIISAANALFNELLATP